MLICGKMKFYGQTSGSDFMLLTICNALKIFCTCGSIKNTTFKKISMCSSKYVKNIAR